MAYTLKDDNDNDYDDHNWAQPATLSIFLHVLRQHSKCQNPPRDIQTIRPCVYKLKVKFPLCLRTLTDV